jgi:hypothetical protein
MGIVVIAAAGLAVTAAGFLVVVDALPAAPVQWAAASAVAAVASWSAHRLFSVWLEK